MNALPARHSLFWKLLFLTLGACLLIVWLSWSWGRAMDIRGYRLEPAARAALREQAARVEHAWRNEGRPGVARALARLRESEGGWAIALDPLFQSLSQAPLTRAEAERLRGVRGIDWPLSARTQGAALLEVPFPERPAEGRLILELPARLKPAPGDLVSRLLSHGLLPLIVTLALCALLYRQLMVPLRRLRQQAMTTGAQDAAAVAPELTRRHDELGDLGRAFDGMATRLQGQTRYQQRLLRDLSHELRTPLSRLQVLCEGQDDAAALRARLAREVQGMQQLVELTLELAWLDTEPPILPREPVALAALWEILVEDAVFESDWPRARLHCGLAADATVLANLTALSRALENLLRNAIRHSPADGRIRLDGRREGPDWLFWLEDQGPGVPAAALDFIFEPFSRLNGARPGGDGFGLGLSIARSAIRLQGGTLHAENRHPGLCLIVRLPAA
ncbi:MAG: histidine kinase sensor domain-containing protein [Pseudomonas oryzihabitans]